MDSHCAIDTESQLQLVTCHSPASHSLIYKFRIPNITDLPQWPSG